MVVYLDTVQHVCRYFLGHMEHMKQRHLKARPTSAPLSRLHAAGRPRGVEREAEEGGQVAGPSFPMWSVALFPVPSWTELEEGSTCLHFTSPAQPCPALPYQVATKVPYLPWCGTCLLVAYIETSQTTHPHPSRGRTKYRLLPPSVLSRKDGSHFSLTRYL